MAQGGQRLLPYFNIDRDIPLQAAINRYIHEHNVDPKPFVWTKPAKVILAKINRLPVPSV